MASRSPQVPNQVELPHSELGHLATGLLNVALTQDAGVHARPPYLHMKAAQILSASLAEDPIKLFTSSSTFGLRSTSTR